jgi:ATP-binding cassette subfamily B (MDR/TAP) protein 1
MNYRTVASFANEEQILEDYKTLLNGPLNKISKDAHILGGLFGFSQFVQYAVYAVLYYAGAQFMVHYGESPENIFISLFAMMFGAFAAGNA